MKTFWQDLTKNKKPFFALAPMEQAADTIFRRVIATVGKPDVFFTEFTNVEGLFSQGVSKVERRLNFTKDENPIIAQIWGLNPEFYFKAAKLMEERGFAGVDINMGCPDKSVTSKGCCSALINNKELAKEIIQATKEGCKDIPVSVKTRIGFSRIQTEEWIGFLLEQDIAALTVHGRTRKEMSKVPNHWDEIEKAVQLRNKLNRNTVIIGNGDVKSVKDGKEKAEQYGLDGIMIGRGVFENAWVFNENVDQTTISFAKRLELLNLHLNLYEDEHGEKLPYQTLKKYYKIYIRDFDGASEMRAKMMETKNLEEIKDFLATFYKVES